MERANLNLWTVTEMSVGRLFLWLGAIHSCSLCVFFMAVYYFGVLLLHSRTRCNTLLSLGNKPILSKPSTFLQYLGGGCHWILVQSAQVICVCMYVICLECSPGLRCAGHVNWTFWVSACFMTKLLGLVMTGWERIIVTGSSWDASTMDIDERQLNVQYR